MKGREREKKHNLPVMERETKQKIAKRNESEGAEGGRQRW